MHMLDDRSSGKADPRFEEFLRALRVWNSEESGRGVVLVAVAMLDDILEKCIRSFLVESDDLDKLLNGFNAPLGSLSARILSAYSFGLLSKAEYEECRQFQKIRNHFAHDVHVSFSHQKVIDLCANLGGDVGQESLRFPRQKFEIAAMAVILTLTVRQEHILARRLKFSGWPRN